MNRVRIVAVAAAGLGVAVVAGTHFQQPSEPGVQPVAQSAAVPAPQAAPSLASAAVAPTPQDDRGPRDPAALVRAFEDTAPEPRLVDVVPPANAAPGARPSLTQARLVPDVTTPTPEPAPGPVPVRLGAEPAPLPGFAPLTQASTADDAAAQPIDDGMRAELDNCAVWVVATPAPGAMLDFSVYAPCDRGARVQVTHAGLSFDAQIGEDGQLMQLVPALAESAAVTVTFADGRSSSDTTPVPDFAAVERVALQWQGPATLLLHAYEFGAAYGGAGHVHPGNPLAPGVDGHGFLTVLGDPALDSGRMAQVYSFPAGQAPRGGAVTLEIEAPVTADSCGRTLGATAVDVQGGIAGIARDIRIDMPGCDGAGGYVVLPGLLPDLRVALN